jgi:hypothetical protein
LEQIITTAVKNKIQKGLSYPLGAELISNELKGIPQFNEIELCFYGRDGNTIGHYVPDESLTKLIGISKGDFTLNRFKEIMIVRWWDDYWSIAIFGINSKNRNASKLGLVRYALSEMKSWLMKKREPSWYEGKRRLYIALTDHIDEVAIIELHNNELINSKYLTIDSLPPMQKIHPNSSSLEKRKTFEARGR